MNNLRAEAAQAQGREIERLEALAAHGHPWLQFPRDLERAFVEDHARRFLEYRRALIIVSFVIFLAAGFIDLLFLGPGLDRAALVRYGIVGPVFLGFLAFSRTSAFAVRQQGAIAAMTVLFGALLFGLLEVGGPSVIQVYAPGFMLLAVLTGFLVRLRFWFALGLLLAFGIAFVAFLANQVPYHGQIVLLYSIYYFLSAVAALFAGYHIEHAARRQFLQDRLLRLKQAELEYANHQLQELVDQDGLTGIANRRYFDRHLSEEWNRARRGGYPLSLLIIDLDFFKNFNDTYGHQAGDDCLIVVAAVLRAHAQRSGDVAARYGGEEFAMILPVTGREDAGEIAWRVVQDIAGYRIPHTASSVADVVTASVGAATLVPSPILSPRDLIAAADEALYRAKASGRNRVELAPAQEAEASAGADATQ